MKNLFALMIASAFFFAPAAFAKSLTCTGTSEAAGLTLFLSSDNWTDESTDSKVKVVFTLKGKIFTQSKNGFLVDSAYVVGARVRLPEDTEKVLCMIMLSDDYKEARVTMSYEGGSIDFGNYSCK